MAKKKITIAAKSRHTGHPTCTTVFRHICENLDADLNSPQCRAIKAHIDDCPNCVAYLDSLKKTVSLYRVYPVPNTPAAVHRKLMAKIALSSRKGK